MRNLRDRVRLWLCRVLCPKGCRVYGPLAVKTREGLLRASQRATEQRAAYEEDPTDDA